MFLSGIGTDENLCGQAGVRLGDATCSKGFCGNIDGLLPVDRYHVDGPMRWIANWLSPSASLVVSLPLTIS